MNKAHIPVLIQEVLDFLAVEKGKRYIDATLGGGGYTEAIVKKGAEVLALDVDEEALSKVRERMSESIAAYWEHVTLVHDNFRNIDEVANTFGFSKVDGVVFDLGVSSFQLEEGERGFSFQKSGPLDMRMDKRLGVTAADLVNALSARELKELFAKFGEEYNTKKIIDEIVRERKREDITSTGELVEIIKRARGIKGSVSAKLVAGVSKRIFQALRIVVNDELGALKEALPKAIGLLASHGRIVVVSFHSLEDRIVKESFRESERKKLGRVLVSKPVTASKAEIESNKRSRSAKLRVFEKARPFDIAQGETVNSVD